MYEIRSMPLDPTTLAELCIRNDIARLRVFGSFARGEQKDGSDLDLLADFGAVKGLLELVRIEQEFSDQLGVRVDLLTEDGLSPHLRERILQSARIVYDRAA